MGRMCPYDPLDGIWKRLKSAGKPEARTHYRDLLALTRHWVRAHMLRAPAVCTNVALQADWYGEVPETAWAEHGLRARRADEGQLLVEALPWRPGWLPGSDVTEPGAGAVRGDRRGGAREVDGDPFLARLKRERYRCGGQREAARAVAVAPPRSTLAVGLPTGAGKSLCAEVWAFAETPKERGHTTVVIVPTVALALDQERALQGRGLIEHDVALVSGQPIEQRASIRARVLDGTQRVVYTSPEGAVGSLAPLLWEAAERGTLGDLVIDEAHIVDQWGEVFRPEFQQLAGLRNSLLDAFPKLETRTLGLSATFTQEALDLFKTLFGHPGPFGAVVSLQTRPEPEYWAQKCFEAERMEHVMEAIHHLPRPLILYLSTREAADKWRTRLTDAGYTRHRLFTGATRTEDRRRIVDAWATGELDIVVATSAFGLGVDVNGVRSVVHACIPENLDRFYQEVGRAGRDGHASVSLALYTHNDMRVANELGQNRVITIELGRERWEGMWANRTVVAPPDQRLYRVNLDQPRGALVRMAGNESNRQWNVRTLTLMARAGLLRVHGEPPSTGDDAPDPGGEEDPAQIVVQLLCDDAATEDRWRESVEPVRQRGVARQRRSREALDSLLNGRQCAGELIAQEYELNPPWHRPAKACGGCPSCRGSGTRPPMVPPNCTEYPWTPDNVFKGPLGRLFERYGSSVLWVEAPPGRLVPPDETAIQCAAPLGLRCVCAKPEDRSRLAGLGAVQQWRILFHELDKQRLLSLPGPAVCLYDPVDTPWMRGLAAGTLQASAPLIVMLPEGTPDPEVPGRSLRETANAVCDWDEFVVEVGIP